MYMRILQDDISNRFRKGDIGKVMENNFDKYDYFLDLGTCYAILFGKVILMKRHFYFYSHEVKELKCTR